MRVGSREEPLKSQPSGRSDDEDAKPGDQPAVQPFVGGDVEGVFGFDGQQRGRPVGVF